MKNRERYLERLKAKYPEKDFANEEDLFGQINDDYDNYDNELSEYKKREKELSDLFTSNPNSATFFMDWRNGEDPVIGMIRKFGDDFKYALEDPDKQEALAQANKEYATRIAKEEEYEKEYQTNISETLSLIEQMQKENGYSDEDIDNAMEFLVGIMRDGLLGKFSKESIEMAFKAINHDSDVLQADREGEVRGRNAKIEERLRKGGRTDGTANLGSKNANQAQEKRMPELGVIDKRYGTKNIWERGGEKRIKY